MARPGDGAQIGVPKIDTAEPKAVRLSLKGALFQDLELYRAAYKAAYGVEVELEVLIPHILETFIGNDRSFRAWRVGKQAASG